MDKYAVSDWHIDVRGKKQNDFHYHKEAMLFLRDIPDKSLYAVGDLVERGHGSKWKDIYDSRKDLFDLMFRKLRAWILGNHDRKMWDYRRIIPVPMCFFLIEDGRLFLHGHQFDFFNGKHKWIGRGVTKMVGWLEKRIHPDVDHWLSGLKDKISKTGRHGDDKKYAKSGLRFTRGILTDNTPIREVLMGHTHRKFESGNSRLLYRNTGCWINKNDVLILKEN